MIVGKFKIKRTWGFSSIKQDDFNMELFEFGESEPNFAIDTVSHNDIIVRFATYNETAFYKFIQILIKYYLFEPNGGGDITAYRGGNDKFEILGNVSIKTMATEGFHERFIVT